MKKFIVRNTDSDTTLGSFDTIEDALEDIRDFWVRTLKGEFCVCEDYCESLGCFDLDTMQIVDENDVILADSSDIKPENGFNFFINNSMKIERSNGVTS